MIKRKNKILKKSLKNQGSIARNRVTNLNANKENTMLVRGNKEKRIEATKQ